MPPKGYIPSARPGCGFPSPDRRPDCAFPAGQGRRGGRLLEWGRSHWAFRPVKPVVPPRVNDPAWVQSPVDAFILATLEGHGLRPSPRADRRTLIRRVTFDLIGLPPTPEEVAAFVLDDLPDAFARLVDRLLASPHHGERRGRHWLNVARYSDTRGYTGNESDNRYFYAYTYRDYVIQAFNDDRPYRSFRPRTAGR